MTVFEYGNDIVIIDMGIQFPEEDMPGIDYIVPNISYLKNKHKNIRAVVFTHGHLDHIGAAPILLEKMGYPLVIALPFTIALIKHRMEDHQKGSSKFLKTICLKSIKQVIPINSFQLKFFEVEHSIMDSMGVILSCDAATVIHMGDWTLGTTTENLICYKHLSKLAKPTILMIESLGATNKEPLSSEKEMWANFETILKQAPGRVIISTFGSQLKRIRDIINYAKKIDKKVAIDGYSMKMNIKIAQQLGYIKTNKETVVDIRKINNESENKTIILCTGAQGEDRAVLPRIVSGNHRFIKLRKKDTVVFSSSIIPGNERAIQVLKDQLYRQCDNVIHNEIMNIHVSGHNNIQAIQKVVTEIKPTYILPVYANHYLLKEAKKVIQKTGFLAKNIFILDNGSIIQFNKQQNPIIMNEKADTSYVFVDGLGVGDVGEVVLRDRQMLSKDGMFVIVAIVDRQTGRVRNSPDIISRGFVYLRESKDLLSQTRKKVIDIINQVAGTGRAINWVYIKDEVRNKIGQFLYTKTQRRPIILPVIIEV